MLKTGSGVSTPMAAIASLPFFAIGDVYKRQVIVKDGGSRDGSIESMRTDGRIHLYQEPDHSIYELSLIHI